MQTGEALGLKPDDALVLEEEDEVEPESLEVDEAESGASGGRYKPEDSGLNNSSGLFT